MNPSTRTGTSHPRYGPLWWLAAFAFWTLLALLSITQTALYLAYRGEAIQWGPIAEFRLADWYTCALFLPALVWLARRYPLGRGHFVRHGAVLLLATTLFVIGKYSVLLPIERRLLPRSSGTLAGLLAANAITELMIFWAVIGILHALEFYHHMQERERTALQLEAELSEARFNSLSAQLRPHFLFNTLNGITTLMRRDIDAADRAVTQLADLLSATLRHGAQQEIPLREEMLLLDEYCAIMQLRYGERLVITRDVPARLGDALVPPFVLQPLVENALEHGIARRVGPGSVRIQAQSDGARLRLLVTDNGPGLASSAAAAGAGIGLPNIRARLAHLYGTAQRVTLESADAQGTRAVVEIPLRYTNGRAGDVQA